MPDESPAETMLAPRSPGLDWFALARAVAHGKRLALFLGFLFGFLIFLVLLRVPSRFDASVEMLPPQIARAPSTAAMLGQTGFGDAGLLGGIASSLQTKTQADVFVLLLQAWPIQDYLVRHFDLQTAYNAQSIGNARQMVATRTRIKSSREGFITIIYTDTDRQRAAAIANAYLDAAKELMRTMAVSESSQRRLFYEGQLAKTKEELARAEVAFKQMQQSNGMVALDTQAKGLIESAAALRSQVTAKEVEVQGLRGYLTESNPQLQIAESSLAALRGKVEEVESRGQGGYSGRSLSSVPESELAFVRASRELKYQEGLYDLMVKQYEGSRIDEARDAPVIQTVAPALVPEFKSGPRRVKDIALAFLGGVVLGILITVVRYGWSSISDRSKGRFLELRRALLRW